MILLWHSARGSAWEVTPVGGSLKCGACLVGIFPNEASILRLIGAVLMEQNEEWQLQHRYMPQ
jgi:hypothetical protein